MTCDDERGAGDAVLIGLRRYFSHAGDPGSDAHVLRKPGILKAAFGLFDWLHDVNDGSRKAFSAAVTAARYSRTAAVSAILMPFLAIFAIYLVILLSLFLNLIAHCKKMIDRSQTLYKSPSTKSLEYFRSKRNIRDVARSFDRLFVVFWVICYAEARRQCDADGLCCF